MDDDVRRLQALIHRRPDVARQLAAVARERELELYDRRIEALQRARATLEGAPTAPLPRRELRQCARLCRRMAWTDEEVARLVESLDAQPPRRGPSRRTRSALSQFVQGLFA